MEQLKGTVTPVGSVTGSIDPQGQMRGAVTIGGAGGYPDYEGPFTVTPSGETQTLATANRALARNITVAPVPGNYGLITWNGSFLTVS